MKILLVGDGSNYHNALAIGLRKLGHEVTVASHGSRWMNTGRDINLLRREGKIGGLLLWIKINLLRSKFKGYDVVSINSPNFIDLKPSRIRKFFDFLKKHNSHVFLTMIGTDPKYIITCREKDFPLRYSDWHIRGEEHPYVTHFPGKKTEWLSKEMIDHADYVYSNVEGAVTALYEYQIATEMVLGKENVTYAGIPIDTDNIKYQPLSNIDGPIKIMVACHKGRDIEKGVDRMLEIVKRLKADFPDKVEIQMVQNVPYNQFLERLQDAHIVVDQLYSYTPATTALLAMAMGRVVVSGGEEEFYEALGEKELRPIINPDPLNIDRLYDDLLRVINDPEELIRRSIQGRQFVEKHHKDVIVANKFLKAWQNKIDGE